MFDSSESRKAANTNYISFLFENQQIEIPEFQRPYSWEKKQINELWDSILENEKSYYIGNIVLIKDFDFGQKKSIVDGQQRLTTLSLVLAAIRDYAQASKIKVRMPDGIDSMEAMLYYFNQLKPQNGPAPKIVFSNKKFDQIYRQIIKSGLQEVDEESLDSLQKNFVRSYREIYKRINEYSKKDSKKLGELLERVLTLEFIVILCKTDSDAYLLFEGLNSTGLDLSIADLVKNGVLKATSRQEIAKLEEVQKKWLEMEGLFSLDDAKWFTKFIRHQWISNKGAITEKKLYRAIIDKISKEKDASSYVDGLLRDAKAYRGIRTGSLEFKSGRMRPEHVVESNLLLKGISLLGFEQIYPVLLSLYNHLDPEDFIKHLRKLHAFSFIVTNSPVSPPKYEKLFANFAVNYPSKIDEIKKIYEELLDLSVYKDDFVSSFVKTYRYKTNGNNELLRMLLQMFLNIHDYEIIKTSETIEHICSQNPTSADKILQDEYLHAIGNLTVLNKKENSKEYSNEPFSAKRELFKEDHFEENRRIAEYSFEDNPIDAISKRSQYIAESMYDLFLGRLQRGK